MIYILSQKESPEDHEYIIHTNEVSDRKSQRYEAVDF